MHTLIPIAFAYALAHYFSLLVFQGQAGGYLISDPLGHGSDMFGTADITDQLQPRLDQRDLVRAGRGAGLPATWPAWSSPTTARSPSTRRSQDATRSQYWMLVVMVGFTSLGLWLLSAVNQ